MEQVSERLVNKLSAKAIFRKMTLDGLEKALESLTEVLTEKKKEADELNAKRLKQSGAIDQAMKLLAAAGLALDPETLTDDTKKACKAIAKQEKKLSKEPINLHRFKATDKNGNIRYWSGSGHTPIQFKQIYETAKPKVRKEMLAAALDYKYPHVFDSLVKCEKQ